MSSPAATWARPAAAWAAADAAAPASAPIVRFAPDHDPPLRSTGAWTMRVAIEGGRIAAESLGAELIVDAIYRNSSVP
jgi:hypothetical protein